MHYVPIYQILSTNYEGFFIKNRNLFQCINNIHRGVIKGGWGNCSPTFWQIRRRCTALRLLLLLPPPPNLKKLLMPLTHFCLLLAPQLSTVDFRLRNLIIISDLQYKLQWKIGERNVQITAYISTHTVIK